MVDSRPATDDGFRLQTQFGRPTDWEVDRGELLGSYPANFTSNT
jgi:hypothetical protein